MPGDLRTPAPARSHLTHTLAAPPSRSFLQHEDTGCMRVVYWRCPDAPDDDQPELCPTKRPYLGSVRFPKLADALWG